MAEHDSHDCFRLSQLVLPREPLLRLYRLIALAIPSIASRNFRIGAAYADTAFKPWLKQGEAISEGGGCYWSLVVSVEEFPGAGSRVNFAEAVRLVAKQWLGEPGTHFDWTFHTRFSGETIRVEIKAKETPNHPQPVGAWDVELASSCPGEGRCHGPQSWCEFCGDTSEMCDDPECHCHSHGKPLEPLPEFDFGFDTEEGPR